MLADVIGPGGWSGDVFGTGATTTVDFDVIADAEGAPSLTNITSSDPTAVIGDVKHGMPGDDQVARAVVTFVNANEQRFLWISVRSDSNGERQYATVSVSLSRTKGVKVELAQLVGPQTWTGALCDGAPASVNYTISAVGSITDAVATPAGEVKAEGRWLKVRFSDSEAVMIAVRGDAAESRISVDEKMRCDFGPPAVNTTVEPGATEPGRDHGHHDGDHRDDGRDHHGNRGDKNGHGDDKGDGGPSDRHGDHVDE